MSDQSDDLRICPHCGQENAAHTLRCIRCGQELEELFELEGFEVSSGSTSENSEDELAPMAEILASLDESPLLKESDKDEEDHQEAAHETEEGRSASEKESPDWLERIRQRAREEEDAAGELVKGGIAMDGHRTQEGRKQVEEAFDGIMRRIREQNEHEKVRRTRRAESGLVDENGDPEWLRRIRELRPNNEEDSPKSESNTPTKDGLDDEWTEEELQDLLRRETGLPDPPDSESEKEGTNEITKPLAAEPELKSELADQPTDQLPGETSSNETEMFHNIPDDDEPLPSELQGDTLLEEVTDKNPAGELNQADTGLDPEEGSKPEENLTGADETEADPEEKVVDSVENETLVSPEVEKELETGSSLPQSEEEPLSTKEILPDLLLLRNQRERAQSFSDIIGQEGRRTIAVLHETNHQGKLGRLVLGLILILGVLMAILVGPTGSVNLPVSAPAAAFAKNLDSIEAGDPVLIVMDYQAATQNDIEPLAERTLEILEEKGVTVKVVTSNPENIWLAGSLLNPVQVPDEFIPGGMLGYLALAAGESPSWGGLPMDQVFVGDPDLFGGVKQVILLSDSADFVRMWLEQVSPWLPEVKNSVITTATSRPILLPYQDSGQLRGYVAGVNDANALSVERQKLVNQRAYQVGMLLMIVVLLLGMITKADEDSQRRSGEQKQ